jgi:FlaA1/EpsC-like NDP-sugar epimerase
LSNHPPVRLVPDLEHLDVAALLGRPEATVDSRAAAARLRGRRILVSGAAGSVGVPLVERLLCLEPSALVLLDSHEDSLFRLYRRLHERSPRAERDLAERVPPTWLLGDVRNRAKLEAVFRTYRPEVVFHLAAYKHVHFGEAQPDEPIAVNVLGTLGLVETALAHGVEAFVYTSSDKAVNPQGIYGATKRLAELVVHWAGAQAGGRFVVVRFVNVLGTRGSVIETFLEQLIAGRPLTITDPDMTRYWMSAGEAVDLLLAAIERARPGLTLLLDPGEAVPVVEMARRLRALVSGATDSEELVYIGSRAGERLAEELASPRERLVAARGDGVLVAERVAADLPLGLVPQLVAELGAGLDRDDPTLGPRLMALARELQ